MKYCVNNINFTSKNEITNYVRNIINNNIDKKIEGNEYEFIIELLKYHPDWDHKSKNLNNIFVAIDKYNKNYCLFIRYENSTIDDISWHYAIRHIPFTNQTIDKIDYIFQFGKYKNQSIYDIDDTNYLKWVINNVVNLKRKDKILINQFIRYGYIPYNPVFWSKSKNKK